MLGGHSVGIGKGGDGDHMLMSSNTIWTSGGGGAGNNAFHGGGQG